MLGNDLDIGPTKVDIADLRVMTHTPKTGEYQEFDRRYYEENMRTNDFLKNFVNHHVSATGEQIDELLTKPYNYMIKKTLTQNAPIRQAYKHVRREEKLAKKIKAAGKCENLNLSPTTLKESEYTPISKNAYTPRGDTVSKGVSSIWQTPQRAGEDRMYGQDEAVKARPPFKFMDPKDDKFSHQRKQETQQKVAEFKKRNDRVK